MKRHGFTLLELIIVIIIIGVLATLGFTQYGKMVEKSRGAEARNILGDIRKLAAAYYLESGNLAVIPANLRLVNIGTGLDQIPSACRASHFFRYSIAAATANTVNILATRCNAGGKAPQGPAGVNTLQLNSNMSSGTDSWIQAGTANY